MPIINPTTFKICLRIPSRDAVTPARKLNFLQRLFATRVSCPQYIPLKMSELLILAEGDGPLKNKAEIIISKTMSDNFFLRAGRKNIKLDLEALRKKYDQVDFPIDTKELAAELAQAGKDNLYEGKILYFGLLEITEKTDDYIKIEQNSRFSLSPEIESTSTVENLQKQVKELTIGTADEAVKDLIAGDFENCIKILAQDHPEEVKTAIFNRQFEPILARLEEESLRKILVILISNIDRLGTIFRSSRVEHLLDFLPAKVGEAVKQRLVPKGRALTPGFNYCGQIGEWFRELSKADRHDISRMLKKVRAEKLKILTSAKSKIETALGSSPESKDPAHVAGLDQFQLSEAIVSVYNDSNFSFLPPSALNEIARIISESSRKRLVRQIETSNLLENVKLPLASILAEKKCVRVAMFSFTSPLLAAALLAARLRGARVKLLLDRKESAKTYSQYEAMVRSAQSHQRLFPDLLPFEIRIYHSTQHLKDVILTDNAAVLTGSQNWSYTAFTENLEAFSTIKNKPAFLRAKIKEFETAFESSGNIIPFPESVKEQPWAKALVGIKFHGKNPPPHELSEIMRNFHLGISDHRGIRNIMEIAKGKGFTIVVDPMRVFHPFMVGMPEEVKEFVGTFLAKVPTGFSFAPASLSRRFHPGYTAIINGLPVHESIMAEIGIELCRFLGREDLITPSIICALTHDTYKDAKVYPDGFTIWAGYNTSHGQEAGKRLDQHYESSSPAVQNALRDNIQDMVKANSEHMSMWNAPQPTPLTAADPLQKWLTVLGDMMASRKYVIVNPRNYRPLSMEEALHLLLNNSFSIEGEALNYLERDPDLLKFVKRCAAANRCGFRRYADLPDRVQEMMRVAESLCDLFPAYAEMRMGKDKELSPDEKWKEKKERMEKRILVIGATLLYGFLKYKKDDQDIRINSSFSDILDQLTAKTKPGSRERKLLELMREADKKLIDPTRADLSPKDDPALWIICLANCFMASDKIHILTANKVIKHLSNAVEPPTRWKTRRSNSAVEQKLISDIKEMILPEKEDPSEELLTIVREGMLARLNARRRIHPVKEIPPVILKVLIKKFGVFPKFIYENFYDKLDNNQKRALVKKLMKAAGSDLACTNLVNEINSMDQPAGRNPDRLIKMIADTALSNGIGSIGGLKEIMRQARDVDAIYRYDYFKQMPAAVKNIMGKIGKPEEKILIVADYDMDGQVAGANTKKSMRLVRAKILARRSARETAKTVIDRIRAQHLPEGINQQLNAEVADWISAKYSDQPVDTIEQIKVAKEAAEWFRDHHLAKTNDPKQAYKMAMAIIEWFKNKHIPAVIEEAEKIADETIHCLIPHRLNDGYGLNPNILNLAARRGFRTIITVDCGIRDRKLVRRAKQMGIEVIITDHHEPDKNSLPKDAVAIINPKLDLKPDHEAYFIPGGIVAHKFSYALIKEAGITVKKDTFLDSDALCAVADIVPMTGENRVFVREGIKRLNSPTARKNRGIAALMKANHIELVDEQALAYGMAPAWNATGRLGQGQEGFELLMARDEKEASERVAKILPYLAMRREIEQSIFRDAEANLQFDSNKDAGIAVAGEWHKGIIGLVASRLVSKHGVPTVAIAITPPSRFSGEEPAYGSMRSIKGVNAVKILTLCSKKYKKETGQELFIGFGGHSGAAGFKIEKAKIADFQRIYQTVCKAVVKTRRQQLVIAGKISEGDISLEEVQLFRQLLSPFGPGFEDPNFMIETAKIKSWEVMGRDRQHIKGELEDGTPFIYYFGNQLWVQRILLQKKAHLIFKVGINKYRGKESVILIVQDIKSVKQKESLPATKRLD